MHLNLARKWRSKKFDEVIGQDLAIRLLKNSLYRNFIFPVYLFSGTRGCGKTSLARIFAAALNCAGLADFQKNPQHVQLPCLACASCSAMAQNNHPDFIEIDAASHTGVDNIRHIIDVASLAPILGTKKIYLIDEAHMLSKAAFNALLKILEEPPLGVVFMLATTDPHKIIETVLSRCFQLFFKPIAQKELVEHLAYICTCEEINYTPEGLALVAQASDGIVRDALNIIERARLIYSSITQEAIEELLGSAQKNQLNTLFAAVLARDQALVLKLCNSLELERYNIALIWKQLVELIRQALLYKHGITSQENFAEFAVQIAHYPQEHLVQLLEICYSHEALFTKTTLPLTALEMILVKMCLIQSVVQSKTSSSNQAPKTSSLSEVKSELKTELKQETKPEAKPEIKVSSLAQTEHPQWGEFVAHIEALKDPLVLSVFKQASTFEFNSSQKLVTLTFGQELSFFNEWIVDSKKAWQPLLEQVFGTNTRLEALFTGTSTAKIVAATPIIVAPPVQASTPAPAAPRPPVSAAIPRTASKFFKPKETVLQITDTQKWPKASLLLKIFPGTITKAAP